MHGLLSMSRRLGEIKILLSFLDMNSLSMSITYGGISSRTRDLRGYLRFVRFLMPHLNLLFGQEFYSRADISDATAIRSTRYLCNALISHLDDQSILGLLSAIQHLESFFLIWGPRLKDDANKPPQKDLLKEVVAAAYSDFLRQLGERDRLRVVQKRTYL